MCCFERGHEFFLSKLSAEFWGPTARPRYKDRELCCGALPKGADVSDYAHRLGPCAPWPAPAQAIIDNAGCRTGHVAPSDLGTTTSTP